MKLNYMLKKQSFFSIFVTLVMILVANAGFATKEYVTNTNDSGTGSLRDLIQNSGSGDTLIIDITGTLSLQSQITIPHELTIIGPGPVHFTIDGTNVTAPLEVGLALMSGSHAVHIEGVRFANFTKHCIGFNSAYSGMMTVFGCSFENNSSTTINVDGGSLIVETSSFINNYSPNEGGVCLFSGTQAKFINTTFYGNDANTGGGALYLSGGNVDLIHCTFFENGSVVAYGKAIYVNGSAVTLRNNIIFNDSQDDELITLFSGSMTTLGGNVYNDAVSNGFSPSATDTDNSAEPGVSIGGMVKDGWGITYFPLQSDTCDAIDVDANPSGLPTYDARRVWRVMDAGFYNEYADAGAVEYTPLRVTSAGNSSPGTFEYVIQNIYFSLYGKTAVVFEITGTAPFVCQGSYLYISNDSTIINGFSQNESAIPGPGTTPGTVTAAYTPIVFTDISGSQVGLDVYGSDVTVAGLSMVGFNATGASPIRISGFNTEISGCHIGVDEIGQNATPNSRGILVYNGSALIGAGKYCGKTNHANRNVVSGNAGCQITLNTMSTNFVQGNFVGLAANGLSIPTAVPSTPDTGIAIISMSASAGSLIGGSDRRMRNVVANQTYGIMISAENNKLFNNYVGSDYSGINVPTGAQNDYGILLEGSMCFNNLIGKQGAGNVVVACTYEGINMNGVSGNKLFGNYVGLGADGLTALGNSFAGIRIDGSSANNQIGDVGKGNYISNNSDGIKMTNGSYHTIVRSNIIGFGIDTTSVRGNGIGITIENGSNGNLIGGCAFGEGNIIGNGGNGIYLNGISSPDNDTIYGNYIGITPAGLSAANSTGIYADFGLDIVEIGRPGPGCANEIAFNGVGIATGGSGSSSLHISANIIHDNTGIGIDLDNDGANGTGIANAPGDNNGAETPLLTSATDCGTGLNLGVQLEYAGNAVIEVYKATDGQEGDSLIIQDTIVFTTSVPEYLALPTLPFGMTLVATATYDDGSGSYRNTSEFSDPVTVSSGSAPSVTITGQDTICYYGSDSTVLSATNIGGATYTWSTVQGFGSSLDYNGTNTTVNITIVPAAEPYYLHDTVIVEVVASGCIGRDSMAITILDLPYVDTDSLVQPTTCAGSGALYLMTYYQNTTYTVYYTDGVSNLTHTATTGSTWQGWFPLDGLSPGTYTVDSISNGRCSDYIYSPNATFTIASPSNPAFVAAGTDLICNGSVSGQIVLTDTAGVSPFQYSIDGGGSWQTSNTFTGLAAGSYVCSVMDAYSCLANDTTVVLNEPSALSFTTVKLDDTCSLSKGEIQFNAAGGTMPYSYSIDGGGTYQTSAIFNGLMNGGYNLAVLDANGCNTTSFTTLNDQSGVSIVVNAYSSQVSCFDSNDGYIDVLTTNPFGGSVTYQWTYNTSPFATTEDLTSLYGGDYELIATDMGGCKDTLPVTITTPSQLLMSVIATDETCSGYMDGTLDTISVSGGTMPYTLNWVEMAGNTSVGTTAPLAGLQAGDYAGLITDANGCVAGDTVTINVGEFYTAAISSTYTDSCINNNSYDFIDGNGVPPSGAASFSWGFANGTPGMTVAQNPTGIVFNWPNSNLGVNYEVTSNAGCVFYDTIYIWIYDTATVSSLIPTDVSCFGASDGSVTATGTGGVGPYQYSFNGGIPAAVNSVSGLGAGTVTCYVVDVATGCQSETHYVGIAEPTQITFGATVSDATCGQSNGTVTFQNVSGGVGNYSYSVGGSVYGSSTFIDTLAPGSYTFYVMDGNGCIETQTSSPVGNNGAPVPVPTIPEGSPYLVCVDNSGAYGYLTAVSNDVSTGTFEWSMSTIGNVISNNDTLYLDDFNTGNHYIYLVESNGMCESSPDSVLLDVNVSDVVNNTLMEFCLGDEVVLDLSTSGEVIWYSSMGEIADTTAPMTTAVPGAVPRTYYYTVGLGDCIFYDSITLVEDPDCDGIVIVNNAFSPNGDGINDLFRIDANALLTNDNTVVIINRWGDVIREYGNYDNVNVAWDGTNAAGEQVPAGTYFYVVEIPSIEYKTTGWVQVVR